MFNVTSTLQQNGLVLIDVGQVETNWFHHKHNHMFRFILFMYLYVDCGTDTNSRV